MTKDLAAENKLLIKKSVSFDIGTDIDKSFSKRKQEIGKERLDLENNSKNSAISIDYYDKVRKFGLEVNTEL